MGATTSSQQQLLEPAMPSTSLSDPRRRSPEPSSGGRPAAIVDDATVTKHSASSRRPFIPDSESSRSGPSSVTNPAAAGQAARADGSNARGRPVGSLGLALANALTVVEKLSALNVKLTGAIQDVESALEQIPLLSTSDSADPSLAVLTASTKGTSLTILHHGVRLPSDQMRRATRDLVTALTAAKSKVDAAPLDEALPGQMSHDRTALTPPLPTAPPAEPPVPPSADTSHSGLPESGVAVWGKKEIPAACGPSSNPDGYKAARQLFQALAVRKLGNQCKKSVEKLARWQDRRLELDWKSDTTTGTWSREFPPDVGHWTLEERRSFQEREQVLLQTWGLDTERYCVTVDHFACSVSWKRNAGAALPPFMVQPQTLKLYKQSLRIKLPDFAPALTNKQHRAAEAAAAAAIADAGAPLTDAASGDTALATHSPEVASLTNNAAVPLTSAIPPTISTKRPSESAPNSSPVAKRARADKIFNADSQTGQTQKTLLEDQAGPVLLGGNPAPNYGQPACPADVDTSVPANSSASTTMDVDHVSTLARARSSSPAALHPPCAAAHPRQGVAYWGRADVPLACNPPPTGAGSGGMAYARALFVAAKAREFANACLIPSRPRWIDGGLELYWTLDEQQGKWFTHYPSDIVADSPEARQAFLVAEAAHLEQDGRKVTSTRETPDRKFVCFSWERDASGPSPNTYKSGSSVTVPSTTIVEPTVAPRSWLASASPSSRASPSSSAKPPTHVQAFLPPPPLVDENVPASSVAPAMDVDVKPSLLARLPSLQASPPIANPSKGVASWDRQEVPAACNPRSTATDPSAKAQARATFVTAKTRELANASRNVIRQRWIAGGLALDWVLDERQGTAFSPYPPEVLAGGPEARQTFLAAEVSRVGQQGRIVTATGQTPDRSAICITWVRDAPTPPSSAPPPPVAAPTDLRIVVKAEPRDL